MRARLAPSAGVTYRDPLAGLRSQVAVKRAVLADREREVTPVLRALLPEETRASIAGLRAAAQAEADTLDTLVAADLLRGAAASSGYRAGTFGSRSAAATPPSPGPCPGATSVATRCPPPRSR